MKNLSVICFLWWTKGNKYQVWLWPTKKDSYLQDSVQCSVFCCRLYTYIFSQLCYYTA